MEPARAVPPADLRQRLVDAATHLFYARGAAVTSVRDITGACGVTPGALYHHFASKEELLFVVVRDIHLGLAEGLAEVRAAQADPVVELGVLVQVVVSRHARNKERARVANREYRLLTGARLQEVVDLRLLLLRQLAECVRSGVAQDVLSLPPGLSPALLATAVFDMAVQVSEWFVDGRSVTSAELARQYARLAYRMAGVEPPDDVLAVGQQWVTAHPWTLPPLTG